MICKQLGEKHKMLFTQMDRGTNNVSHAVVTLKLHLHSCMCYRVKDGPLEASLPSVYYSNEQLKQKRFLTIRIHF